MAPVVLKRAAQNQLRLLELPLLKRQSQASYLTIFSAFLAPREPSAPYSRKRRLEDKAKESALVATSGVVLGCSLSSVVAYLRLQNVSTAFTVRQIEAALTAVAAAALNTSGVDQRVLCAGLASSRVLKAQLAHVPTPLPVSFHSRNGNPFTMLGTTAAIFVVFAILTSTLCGSVSHTVLEEDVEFFVEKRSMEQVLDAADMAVANAVPVDGLAAAVPFEINSVDAEHRAIQRARCGVRAAREFASRHGLAPLAASRKALEWYARAAWPSGEVLNERTHLDCIARMSSPTYYLQPPPPSSSATDLDLVPLSQLKLGLSDRRGGDSDVSSEANTTSSRSLSSANSVVSDGGLDALHGLSV